MFIPRVTYIWEENDVSNADKIPYIIVSGQGWASSTELSVEERVCGGAILLPENEHPPVACLVTLVACYFAGTFLFSMSDRIRGRTYGI